VAEPAIELFADDLPHVLGYQRDDQVDDALLAAAVVTIPGMRLLVLHHAADLFGDEMDDGIDDALLVEVAALAAPVAVVVIVAAVAPVVAVAAAAPLPVTPIVAARAG
jgi:hypothetical protein